MRFVGGGRRLHTVATRCSDWLYGSNSTKQQEHSSDHRFGLCEGSVSRGMRRMKLQARPKSSGWAMYIAAFTLTFATEGTSTLGCHRACSFPATIIYHGLTRSLPLRSTALSPDRPDTGAQGEVRSCVMRCCAV